jgi:hypothetical protein
MKALRKTVFPTAVMLFAHMFLVMPCHAGGTSADAKAGYPVFADANASLKPSEIVARMAGQNPAGLSLPELIDLAVAQAYLKNYPAALGLVDGRLLANPEPVVKADLLACRAVICALKSEGGKNEKSRLAYVEAMKAAKEASQLRPDNVELARHYHALATKAEDALEQTVSADLVMRLDPIAGKPVMDLVTGGVIIVAIVGTMYAISNEKNRSEIIARLPDIVGSLSPAGWTPVLL